MKVSEWLLSAAQKLRENYRFGNKSIDYINGFEDAATLAEDIENGDYPPTAFEKQ